MSKNYTFYRLFNLNFEECYVGSTTNYKKRIQYHKSDCNNPNSNHHNRKVYKFIRENGGFKNWQFEIIEEQILNHKDALEIESDYILLYSATLNSQVPSRTEKEWDLYNKEHVKQYKNQYYLDNKKKIREQYKQYYLDNKKKISEQKRQWRLNNKDILREQDKQRYLNNKDKKK